MIPLVNISESAHGLELAYPVWCAVALALATAALLVFARVRGTRMRRRWPLSLAVVFAAWSTAYVATYRVSVQDDAAHGYAFLRFDHAVRWKDAADIYLEQGGGDSRIVVVDRERRAYAFDVAELSLDDRERVLARMVDRMPAGAFARTPELMRRHANPPAQPAGSFLDLQI